MNLAEPQLEPWMDDECVAGYLDGLDLTSPDPGSNRSGFYRHGWLNGRDDHRGQPRQSYEASMRDLERLVAEAEVAK